MPLRGDDGEVVGALCVFAPESRTWSDTDVATLEQLAEAVVTELELSALLRQYEGDRLRWGLAIDAAGIGAFDWDLVSGRLVWDEQLIAMFGYDVTDFEESIEAFNARLHPDDLPRVTEALQACIATCGEYDAEYRVIRPDGDVRWVHARGRALAGPDGAAVRLLGAAYDTTGERSAAARVTRVLEAMPAGFYSLDREWRFTHVNAEAERLLGRSREELLGRVLWEEWPAAVNSVFEDNYRAAVRTGEPVSFDAHYPAPLDGWYELRAWPSPDGLSVYFLEVTERRRVQEKAEQSAQRLALLARVSAELAGTLDATTATSHIPRLVVPALADFCIITVIDPDGRPRDVGSWHADPAMRPVLERYAALRLDAVPATSPLARTLNSGVTDARGAARPASRCWGPPRPATCSGCSPRASAAVLPLRGRGRMLGLLTLYSRDHDFAPRGRPVHGPGRRRPGRAWRWTTPASTARSSSSPRACSAACSPIRRSPTTPRSPCGTCPPPRPRGWAATGTTPSCSPAGRPCSSSATSSATTPRRPRRWGSCAACCGASRPTATPPRRRCCAGSTPP